LENIFDRMNFEDTKEAYRLKNNNELYRAFYLYRLIANNTLVALGSKLALWALQLGLPISGLFKHTVFKQFCAGSAKEDSIKLVHRLADLNVKSYMHFAAEGQKSESGMDNSLEKTLETLSFSKETQALPFTVFKATSLGPVALFEKKSNGVALNKEEQAAWNRMLERVQKCCSYAKKLKVRMLIDAEESWIQAAIDEIAEDLMETFNREQALIFTTVQMYRKDRLSYLTSLLQKAEKKGFTIGVKLVRGAYIEKENKRARELGIPSPICESKEATDINFNAALDLILPKVDRCNLFIGSHSESSILKVIQWMKAHQLPNDHPTIWFSQLYGMADHISFNLASSGYQVVKYVPYGPVKEVIPYLIRRAEENTSVSGQTPRELSLIKKEIDRRKVKAVAG
jgi:proline dehydrogenase